MQGILGSSTQLQMCWVCAWMTLSPGEITSLLCVQFEIPDPRNEAAGCNQMTIFEMVLCAFRQYCSPLGPLPRADRRGALLGFAGGHGGARCARGLPSHWLVLLLWSGPGLILDAPFC